MGRRPTTCVHGVSPKRNCRECHREYRAEHRVLIRENEKKYYQTHREQEIKRTRKYNVEHREQYRESTRKSQIKYARENPQKIIAQRLARKHIPLGSSCSFGSCGSQKNLEHAHLDYSEPLNILTLCRKHHTLIDRFYRRHD